MHISFNPLDAGERDVVSAICAAVAGLNIPAPKFAPSGDEITLADLGATTTQDDPPVQPDGNQPQNAVNEQVTAQVQAAAQNHATNAGEVDKHGMTHDPAVHQTPPKKKADGYWTARRGFGDQLKAAIALHNSTKVAAVAGQMTQGVTTQPVVSEQEPLDPLAPKTQMPAPASKMPAPTSPGSPTPNTPPAPINYDQMGERFMAMIEGGTIQNYEQLYAELGVHYHSLETDQRGMCAVTAYMDYRDAGHEHSPSVAQALVEHPAPVA